MTAPQGAEGPLVPFLPDDDAAPPLLIRGLTVSYGRRDVLRAVDMEVPAGRVRALLGPNGAGKTTLVRAICGRIAPKTGTVEVCGRAAASEEARRWIGLAPQDVALYRALTVRENLEVFGAIAGLSGPVLQQRVADILVRTHVAERANERIDRLSGGWQKRVNLAAALLAEPRLLVLDEPSAGVDREAWAILSGMIRRLAEEDGLGILIVTHDFLQAEAVADDVTILDEGAVICDGPIAALLEARFQGHREVEVNLARLPSPERAARLAALGLVHAPMYGGSSLGAAFTGFVPGSSHALAELLAGLEREGIAPSGLVIREPGLAQLYRAVLEEARQ